MSPASGIFLAPFLPGEQGSRASQGKTPITIAAMKTKAAPIIRAFSERDKLIGSPPWSLRMCWRLWEKRLFARKFDAALQRIVGTIFLHWLQTIEPEYEFRLITIVAAVERFSAGMGRDGMFEP